MRNKAKFLALLLYELNDGVDPKYILKKTQKKGELDWPITHNINHYIQSQIENDQPGSHDFRRFLRQFRTDFLEIWEIMPFSILILTAVKNSQNYI